MIPWKGEGCDHDREPQPAVDSVRRPYTIPPYLLSEGVLAVFLRLETVHRMRYRRPFICILAQGPLMWEGEDPHGTRPARKSALFSSMVQSHWGFQS